MILVTGATGTVGQELCRLLLEAKAPFRAMCRSDAHAEQFSRRGVETVRGSFDDPASLSRAMHGCRRLFLLVPGVPAQEAWQRMALDVAVETGVEHITRLSAADANLDTKVPWARAHAVADHDLRSRAVRWTILKPTGFMQNMLWSAQPIAHGMFPHVTGVGRVAYIDAGDVAEVARRTLTENAHDGATYFLTGPEALSAADIATRASAVMGRKVEPVQLREEDLEQRLRAAGLSDWDVLGLRAQYSVIAGGFAVDVTEEVRRLTGRAPRAFLDFARDELAPAARVFRVPRAE